MEANDSRVKPIEEREPSTEGAGEIAYIDYQQPYLYWERDDDRGGFFADKGALEEHCARYGLLMPRWVWGTLPQGFLIDAEEVLARALEDLHNEARNLIPDSEVERLQIFLDEWAMAQKPHSFDVDYDTAVLLESRPENT